MSARTLVPVMAVAAAATLILGTAGQARAQAGEWRLGGRLIAISTSAETGAFGSGESVISIDDAWSAEIDATVLVTDSWAVEMMLTSAPHDLAVTGGGLSGLDVGRVWIAQSTITLQYQVPLWGRWRPYVGLGLGLAWLHSSDTTSLARTGDITEVRSDVMSGVAGQVGIAYRQSRRWIFSADIKYSGASGDVRLVRDDGSALARVATPFEPWIVGVGAAYRF